MPVWGEAKDTANSTARRGHDPAAREVVDHCPTRANTQGGYLSILSRVVEYGGPDAMIGPRGAGGGDDSANEVTHHLDGQSLSSRRCPHHRARHLRDARVVSSRDDPRARTHHGSDRREVRRLCRDDDGLGPDARPAPRCFRCPSRRGVWHSPVEGQQPRCDTRLGRPRVWCGGTRGAGSQPRRHGHAVRGRAHCCRRRHFGHSWSSAARATGLGRLVAGRDRSSYPAGRPRGTGPPPVWQFSVIRC